MSDTAAVAIKPALKTTFMSHGTLGSKDLEATRKFYEEIIGLPLTATWCEKDMLFGAEHYEERK